MTRRIMAAAAIVAGLSLVSLGCNGCNDKKAQKKTVRDSGSDTMVNLAQVWAEEYHKVAADAEVEVSGGGSGVGIGNLIKGITDIANASRDMTEAEKRKIHDKTGKDPAETPVGRDALAVYVNKDSPIEELAVEDLARIFGKDGDVTKWSQLGADTSKIGDQIVVVGRQNSSGTYAYFNEHVLKNKDFRMDVKQMSGSKDVVELVGKTPGGIGYSGMGYKTDAVKFVKIAAKKGQTAYEPTLENAISGKYPLARLLYMYTLADPPAQVSKYIEWVLSPQGQKILADTGYIPIKAAEKTPASRP